MRRSNILISRSIKIKNLVFYILIIMMTFSSCSLFHGGRKSDKQAQDEMTKRQNKAIDEEVKKYDKKYNEQTDRQAEDQKKRIKKSRKKPKHMNTHKMKKPKKMKKKKMGMKSNERKFFLWRWLGI